ncbi:MAG: AraC family transcriptional regulator [Candidatus Eremiobacterota bacterium]
MPVIPLLGKERTDCLSESYRLNTKLSITDINMNAGFESNSHFSCLFHRYFGMSPKRFRKNSIMDKNSNFEQEIFLK